MPTEYVTDRLIIRVLDESWYREVYDFLVYNCKLFDPYEPVKPDNYYTKQYQKSILNTEYQSYKNRNFLRFYIFCKDNPNKIIGTISFGHIQKNPFHSCILGYKFDQDFHGHGFAYESVNACIGLVSSVLCMHRIEAYIMPSNHRSLKLIRKLNFVYEGTSLRLVNISGNWEDHHRYAYINYALE